MDEETTDLIRSTIDEILAEYPYGVCTGYLDNRVRTMLMLKNLGIRDEALVQIAKQFRSNN
jgi:hypothetical protein